MKSYIGCKVIKAEKMDKEIDGEIRYGYKVVYPDGYTSWSPKYVFENAYREITKDEKELI